MHRGNIITGPITYKNKHVLIVLGVVLSNEWLTRLFIQRVKD